MYLLNHEQIRRYVAAPRGTYLDIINFNPHRLQHTSYYFALGRDYEISTGNGFQHNRLTDEAQYLVLPPGGYAIVKTHETFMLSDKVLGVIGPISDFVRQGLELVHSPFIDPMFYGQLELGLGNRLQQQAIIKLGRPLGKVSFFDISDTYPIEVIRDSLQEEKFKKRVPKYDDPPVPVADEDDSGFHAKKPWSRD